MVLDFLGMGAKVFTPEQQKEANMTLKTQPAPSKCQVINQSRANRHGPAFWQAHVFILYHK